MLQLQLDLIIIKWERYWDWLLFPIYNGAMWSNRNSREVDKKMLAPNLLRSNFMMSNFEQVIINILANLARRENTFPCEDYHYFDEQRVTSNTPLPYLFKAIITITRQREGALQAELIDQAELDIPCSMISWFLYRLQCGLLNISES